MLEFRYDTQLLIEGKNLDEDAINEYFTNNFKQYIRPDNIYLNMNALARQYFALDELCVNLKNRYKNLVYLCFPNMKNCLKEIQFILVLP